MLALRHRRLLSGLAALLCTVFIGWFVLEDFFPAPPSKVTMATAFAGASFEYYGERYRERFARANVKLELRETAGAVENLRLLQNPHSGVQIAFMIGGVSDGRHAPGILSLGTIYYTPFWIFYTSIEPIDRLSQLKGKRIAVGPEGSGTRFSAEKILAKGGVNSETATFLPFAGLTAAAALKDGKVDVVWFSGGPDSEAAQFMLRNPNVRLMSFPMAEAFTRIFPGLVHLVLPQGVIDIEGPIPAHDVSLIATTNRVLVRSDLHPEIVHLLLRTMVQEHGEAGIFQRSGEFPTSTDPEYPVAASAVDFYKNGPSFLQRHLPLWLTTYVQRAIALLVAGIAIAFPLFSFAPRLYLWFWQDRVRKLYRRLRVVEEALQTELSVSQVEALQTDLENIDRAARILPKRHSDLFFVLQNHISLTRTQLASRLVEARSYTTKIA